MSLRNERDLSRPELLRFARGRAIRKRPRARGRECNTATRRRAGASAVRAARPARVEPRRGQRGLNRKLARGDDALQCRPRTSSAAGRASGTCAKTAPAADRAIAERRAARPAERAPCRCIPPCAGNCATSSGERFRFRATMLGGVLAIQSVTLKVPNSEKCPLSNPSRKWHSPGPSPCKEWPCPRGKYQVSPTSKSATSACPSDVSR